MVSREGTGLISWSREVTHCEMFWASLSRNFSLGVALGQGRSLKDILAERKSVTEGVYTAAAVAEIARREHVDMPICQAVDGVINLNVDLDAIIDGLLRRPLNIE